MINRADRHPERVKAMHARLQAWQKDVMAVIPEEDPEWATVIKRPMVPNNAHL